MSSNMKTSEFISKYQQVAKSRGLDLTPKEIQEHLSIFYDVLRESVKTYPGVSIDPIGLFSVTALSERVRVLRGNVYQSRSRYKVRYYISDDFHKELCETYDGYEGG